MWDSEKKRKYLTMNVEKKLSPYSYTAVSFLSECLRPLFDVQFDALPVSGTYKIIDPLCVQ